MKYVARITEGCTAFNFEINGENWRCEDKRYEFKDKDNFLKALASKVHKGILEGKIKPQAALEYLMEPDRDHYDSHVCDQCGDTVSWQEWDIKGEQNG